jgi:hypothetical protein
VVAFRLATTRAQPVHSTEFLALVAAAVAFVGCCVADSQRRLFWCDEAFTAFAVGDPSLGHMLAGLRDEINAMPPHWLTLLGRAVVCAVLVVLAGGAITQLARGRATTDQVMSVAASDRLTNQLAIAREFPDVPVVTRNIIDFAPLAYYLPARGRVMLLTDKDIVSPFSTIHHGMAMQRHYRPESTATLDEILTRKGQFLPSVSYDLEVIVKAMKQWPEWHRAELHKFTSLWRFVGRE